MRCGYRLGYIDLARRLFGIEQEAAMDAVVGTHAPRRAVHATVHSKSNLGCDRPFVTTELALAVRAWLRVFGRTEE